MPIPICPFCLTRHDFGVPPRCNSHSLDIPQLFLEEYDRIPTLWLVTVGFKEHGKSSYIGALTEVLENISSVWKTSTCQYLDEYTFTTVKEIREQTVMGKVVDPTPTWKPREQRAASSEVVENHPVQPLLMHAYEIPNFGSCCMITYDVAGEYFSTPNAIRDDGYLRSLNAVKNIWFFVDLDQVFKPDNTMNVNQLLQVYLAGMTRMGWSLRNRNLIVIYTKADLYTNNSSEVEERHFLPQEVCDYYQQDPFDRLLQARSDRNLRKEFQHMEFFIDAYLSEMEHISSLLEFYTRDEVPGGQDLINLAAQKQIGLKFCIVSALGTKPTSDGVLPVDKNPHRVIDPFLWALKMNKGLENRNVKLILDPKLFTPDVAADRFSISLLSEFYSTMQSFDREITTYFIGNASPASIAGQRLPNHPPRHCGGRFIGPILDQGSQNDIALVLTTDEITDLDDYRGSQWENHMYYVAVAEFPFQKWKNTFTLRSETEFPVFVNGFNKILQEF